MVTGIDNDTVFQKWEVSRKSRWSSEAGRGGGGSSSSPNPKSGERAKQPDDDGGYGKVSPTRTGAVPVPTAELESDAGCSSSAGDPLAVDPDAAKEDNSTSFERDSSTLLSAGEEATSVATCSECSVAAGDEAASTAENGSKRGASSPASAGMARLCRRAVVLLTRSPSCPDLVERQNGPANQRTYDQMEPLLARANMSYKDLHPEPVRVC